MENRRTIRNWDAFGHLERLMTRFMLTDLFDPVLKLVLNFFSVILLGVTFVYQSISMLIALDVVFVAIYQSASAQLSRAFAAIIFFLPNERERTASISGLVKFYSNVMWVRIVYNLHKDCFIYMSAGPLAVMALMQALISFYTERLATEQSAMTQAMYSIFLFTLFLMVFNSIAHAPDYLLLETVLLLRSPIDALCNSVDTVFRVCDTTMGADNTMPVYTTQIARYSFWSAVHLLLMMLVWSSQPDPATSALSHRADKFLYFTLFMHDLLDLFIPLRQLLIQVRNEQYVAKNFPRLSATELTAAAAETCSVCLCEHNPRTVRLRCNHLLHAHCLQRILQQSVESRNPETSRCPMCRAPIELPPSASARSSVFGTGTRGNRNVQATVTIPFFGSLTARQVPGASQQQPQQQQRLQRADGTGGPMRAEQLIAEHLGQQNLQQGDLIHIRIIPRGARAGLTRAATAPAATPSVQAPPVATTQVPAAAPATLPAPPSESHLSALHAIHRDFLYSNDTSRSPSASSSSAQVPQSAARTRSPRVRGATSTGALHSLVETAMQPAAGESQGPVGLGSPVSQIPDGGELAMDIADEDPAAAASSQRVESVDSEDSEEDRSPRMERKRKWTSEFVGCVDADAEIAEEERVAASRIRRTDAGPPPVASQQLESEQRSKEQSVGSPAPSPQAEQPLTDVFDYCGEDLTSDNFALVAGAELEEGEGEGLGDEDSASSEESSDDSSVSTAHSSGSESRATWKDRSPVPVTVTTTPSTTVDDSTSYVPQDVAQPSPQPAIPPATTPAPTAVEGSRKQVLFVDLTTSDDDEGMVGLVGSSSHRGNDDENPDRPLSGVKRSRDDVGASAARSDASSVPTRRLVGADCPDPDEEVDTAYNQSGLVGSRAHKHRRGGAQAYTQCSSGEDSSESSDDGSAQEG